MAGDDDGNRVAPVGEAHRPRRAGAAETAGKVAVGAGRAVGDGAEGVPDSRLERSPDRGKGQGELGQVAREVGGELSAALRERRGVVIAYPIRGGSGGRVQKQARQRGSVGGQEQGANRAVGVGVGGGHGDSIA